MTILKNYLKITFRSILKFKNQNLVSILGVSVGLVLSIIGLYWLKYETSYDDQIKDSDRIYQVVYKNTSGNNFVMNKLPCPLLEEAYQNIPDIQAHCFAKQNTFLFVNPQQPGREVISEIWETDKRFFALMDLQFVNGEAPAAFDANSVILTEKVARQLFGTSDVLHEKVTDIWEEKTYEIVGVVKDNPSNSSLVFEALVPLPKNRYSRNFFAYVLLDNKAHKGQTLSKLNTEMQKREENPVDLIPFQQSKYRMNGDSFLKAYSPLLAVVVSCLFLLVCTFVNLYIITMTKFLQRVRECVFHRQLGAGTKHIFGLFYLEIGLLLVLSFVFCFLFVKLLAGPFDRLTNIPLSGSAFYGFAIKVSLFFFLFLLLAQVFVVRYINKLSTFRHVLTKPFIGKTNRNILFVQLFISGIFIFVLSVVYFQFSYMIKTPTGFASDNVVFLDLRFDQKLKNNSAALMTDLKTGAMITDALAQTFVIFDDNEQTVGSNRISGLEGINQHVKLASVYVSQETAPFFQFQLAAGRFVEHIQSPEEVMLNEEAVKQLGITEPVGKIFQLSGTSYKIVGVVKNYISKPLSSPIPPFIYFLYQPNAYFIPYTAYVKYKTPLRAEALRFIDEVCKRYSPDYNKEKVLKPMDSYIRSFYKKESIVLTILSFVTFACLLITIWGIFGVVSFTLKQQRKSIAIRKVMGADRTTILQMYLRQYLLLALAACIVSILVSFTFVKGWLELYAHRISLDVWIFLIVFAVVLGVVALITLLLVSRTIAENPADVVKENN